MEGWAICQCLGDSVFIPAGAPHQVFVFVFFSGFLVKKRTSVKHNCWTIFLVVLENPSGVLANAFAGFVMCYFSVRCTYGYQGREGKGG